MRRLAAMRMPLTVCPLSNVRLCGVASMGEHPILKLLDAGIVATINSDDPAYFGGSINRNFEAMIDALPITCEHLKTLALNSFEASFVGAEARARLLGVWKRSLLNTNKPVSLCDTIQHDY
jgi:adenosine deaminase